MSDRTRFHQHARRGLDAAVRASFTALADDPAARACFARLLERVRERSPLLRSGDAIAAVDVLRHLARRHTRHVGAIDDWTGGSDSFHVEVHALVQHLLARYPVPRLFVSAWLGADDASRLAEQEWCIAHGAGRRLRDVPDLPLRLTRRMEHILLTSPPHLPIRAAMRRAELLGLDAPPGLVDAILQTDLAADLTEGEFWRSAMHFFVNHWDALGATRVKAIVDFLYATRVRSSPCATPDGVVLQPPPDPRFSLAGRTPQSLQRLVDAWHAELGRRHHTGRSWTPSGWSGLRYLDAAEPDAPATRWHIEELLHSGALLAEGRTLHHCVATYEWSCIRGAASIWSLRRQAAEGEARPVYTIEVDPRTRTIVQIRGKRNRHAAGHPRRIIATWARQERLTLAEYA